MAHCIVHLGISAEHDMIVVRQRTREICTLIGFGVQDQIRVATAVSELLRAVFATAAKGEVELSLDHLGAGASLLIVIHSAANAPSVASASNVADNSGAERTLAEAMVSASRLIDGCNLQTPSAKAQVVTLSKLLPATSIVNTATLSMFVENVMHSPIASTFNEITLQNRVLLDTLAELRSRQDDLLLLTQELEDTNRGVLALYADIEEKAERLRQADIYKDEFLATLAHELRNPLAPIRNAVEIMRRSPLHDFATHDNAQQIITRQVSHLARLVDDLLDVARISQGKITLRREPTPLNAFIDLAVETIQPFIQSRHHRLQVQLPDQRPGSPLQVNGDPVRLAQIIGNLLNNAAKYTASGGEIDVIVECLPQNRLQIAVQDNGIGLSKERIGTVFALFAQGETAPDRAQDGLGIGLSLVQRLVAMHEGEIRIESEGHGRGSRFIVELPLIDTAAADDTDDTAVIAECVEVSRQLGAPLTATKSLKILLVDDNPDLVTMTATLLESFGHATVTAHDATSALKQVQSLVPDVILLDIGLPGIDGYEVAAMLRSEASLHATRLIAVTGYGTPADREKSLQAGFDLHLVKPVDLETLLNALTAGDQGESCK